MKRIEVAVGVIKRDGKLLVGQRIVKDLYYQKWEFPGGKLEPNETGLQALKRELSEELAIEVVEAKPLIQIDHDYIDRHVRLHVFEVVDFQGEPCGKEGQAIQWVAPKQCLELDFLEANKPIVNAAVLPKLVLITDIARFGLERTIQRISTSQTDFGSVIIQLREPFCEGDFDLFKDYVESIRCVMAEDSLLLLNGELDLACDGVHLNRHRAKQYRNRSELAINWVSVASHDKTELDHAEVIADFTLLSPVQETQSHPDAKPLGWEEFNSLVNASKLPVYALGGLSLNEIGYSREMGAQGVSILSAAWQ